MTLGETTELKRARKRSEHIASIQVMRGIAAVLVVIAHSVALAVSGRASEGWALADHLGNFEDFGAIGVDLFFVISGFVMASSVEKLQGPRNAGIFLARRWARIAPPYWIVGGFMVALGAFGLLRAVKIDAGSVFNLLMFVPWMDASTYSVPPLYVGWTLSFEFTFYLLVAVMVAFRLAQRMGLLVIVLVTMVAVGVVFPTDFFIMQWFSNPIMLEFALGIVAYLLWHSHWLHQHRGLGIVAGVLGAAALGVQLVVGYGDVWDMGSVLDGSQSSLRVLLWGLPAFLIFIAVLPLPGGRNYSGAALAKLGDTSYSIYLVHVPALYVLGRALEMSPVKVQADVIAVVGCVTAVAAGFAYFMVVEKPLTAWASNKIPTTQRARA